MPRLAPSPFASNKYTSRTPPTVFTALHSPPPLTPTHADLPSSLAILIPIDLALIKVTGEFSSGIISNAIANAEKLPTPQGQENVSLLHQHSSTTTKSSPISTQFTFTCDSQVFPSAQWPGADPTTRAGYGQGYPNKPTTMMGSVASTLQGSANAPDGPPHTSLPNTGVDQDLLDKKKAQRLERREMKRAEAQRRRKAQADYRAKPPPPEDDWICEFCEYESIFGKRPKALIRQYEHKELMIRRKDEERRRMLEKAKARGRKGKKAGKGGAKSAALPNQSQDGSQSADQPAEDGQQSHDDDRNNEFGEEKTEPAGGSAGPRPTVNGSSKGPPVFAQVPPGGFPAPPNQDPAAVATA